LAKRRINHRLQDCRNTGYIINMMLTLLTTLLFNAQMLAAKPVSGVLAEAMRLPPAGSAWAGDSPHLFLGGQARMFCGSHGTISGNDVPPTRQGQSATLEYDAVFTGELVLTSPETGAQQTYAIHDPIRMTERVTVRESRGGTLRYATELTAVEFEGADFPDGVRVRESPQRRSAGTASIARQRQGGFRIEASYQVWLELSLDGGRSWHVADNAVGMKLVPEPARATLKARRVAD
jgi:hypothetical protein